MQTTNVCVTFEARIFLQSNYYHQNRFIITWSFKRMKKILIVDDFPSHRGMFKLVVGSTGAKIEEAHNGQEALAILESHSFDAVVTDIEMPAMNGYDLIKNIRSKSAYSTLPIVVISGHSVDKQFLEEFGVKKCISKPFNRETLAKEIFEIFDASDSE